MPQPPCLNHLKMKMMNNGDYIVRLVDLPGTIYGCTRLGADGFANIYINAKLSPEARKKAFQHEIRHIERDDFYNNKPIQEIEAD